jgi:glycosyltransferase involved in cell wall biosynthesis
MMHAHDLQAISMTTRPLTIFASFPTVPLTDYLPSGDGLVAYEMIRQLSARGHTVHVVTPRAELQEDIPERVTIHQMGRKRGASRPDPVSYMTWTRQVLRDVRRSTNVDLIHELNPVFSLRSLAFADSGLPVVLGPHSSRWPAATDIRFPFRTARRFVKRELKDLCLRWQHRRASAVLLSTPAALNNVSEPERMNDKLFILPPGVNAEQFAPDTRSRVSEPTILFLANVTARKGIYSLLEAFGLLVTKIPEARLIIAGDGPDVPAVKELVGRSSWQSRVEFYGRIHHSEVPAIMNRCSVYCLPSHGEPFGMTAIEAMACGKPLVVTNAGGLAYMVSNSGGRRVEVGNSNALSDALEELLSNPGLCEQMGRYNRTVVETTYAWPAVATRLEDIYFEVVNGRRSENPDAVTEEIIRSYRRRLRTLTTEGVPAHMEASR